MVITAKRIVNGNTGAQGSLDNNHAVRAILQYRNTPIQNIRLFPGKLLLHRQLHDFIPSQLTLYKLHANWIATAQNHEMVLSRQNIQLIERYNPTVHTLCPLQKGQIVAIQWVNRDNTKGIPKDMQLHCTWGSMNTGKWSTASVLTMD